MTKPTIKELVDQVIPENSHAEVDWGSPVGNETGAVDADAIDYLNELTEKHGSFSAEFRKF
ncbi:TPA: type II toxin-antitoxin system CcdA family antitoxin [Enterobacter roggenkampii]|uniref:AbrB/MazE/SpoVT family DNA-binding domain-containing protein n=1 Tax=Enterobacter roggenkampii TaxID=1812935 RepID=UPI00378627A4